MIGYLWSRMAATAAARLESSDEVSPFLQSKVLTARFYFHKILPETESLLKEITSGKCSIMALDDEHWAA